MPLDATHFYQAMLVVPDIAAEESWRTTLHEQWLKMATSLVALKHDINVNSVFVTAAAEVTSGQVELYNNKTSVLAINEDILESDPIPKYEPHFKIRDCVPEGAMDYPSIISDLVCGRYEFDVVVTHQANVLLLCATDILTSLAVGSVVVWQPSFVAQLDLADPVKPRVIYSKVQECKPNPPKLF